MQRFSFLIALPLLCAALAAVHADEPAPAASNFREPTPLWSNAPLTASTVASEKVERDAVIKNLADTSPLVQTVREWRDTLRGEGETPQRAWTLARAGQNALQLEVGRRDAPKFGLAGLQGNEASIGLRLGAFTVGSTRLNSQLDGVLTPYNAVLGEAQASDAPGFSYLQARALQAKNGNLDLIWASGQTKGQASPLSLASARAEWKLKSLQGKAWTLRGEWGQSSEEAAQAAAWNVGVNGAVAHPWGEALLEGSYRDAGAGFRGFSDASRAVGQQSGRVSLRQDVKVKSWIGGLQGSAKLIAADNRRTEDELSSSTVRRNASLEGSLDGRWDLGWGLSVTARHQRRMERDRFDAPRLLARAEKPEQSKPQTPADTPQPETSQLEVPVIEVLQLQTSDPIDVAPEPPAEETTTNTPVQTPIVQPEVQPEAATDETAMQPTPDEAEAPTVVIEAEPDILDSLAPGTRAGVTTSEAGLEWKLPGRFVLKAGVGHERADRDALIGEDVRDALENRGKERVSVGLDHRLGSSAWGVQMSREKALRPGAGEDAFRRETVKLQGEQSLFSWLKLRGAMQLHEAEGAQTLSSLLNASNARDERSAEALLSLSSVGRFALRYSDWRDEAEIDAERREREYGVKWNLGRGEGQAGLGMSVEWSKRPGETEQHGEKWRVGLTYR